MNIKILKSWTLRVAVFGLLINEPLLSPSVAISQDTHVLSPITTLQDNQPLPSDFIEIFQDQTVLSLITTLREIDNTERQSPYKSCSYSSYVSNLSIFDSNCELKEKNELLTYMSEERFERIVQSLPSKDNIPAVSYLSDNELVRLEETLEKLIELKNQSVLPLKRLLTDESQLLRESAIYVLSEISHSSAFARQSIKQPFFEVLANDESPAVRDSAAFALARIDPRPEVIDALINTLFDNQKPIKVRQSSGLILNKIPLKNISSVSVKFLVEETNNLGSNFMDNGGLNFPLAKEYCTYSQGLLSDPSVASIVFREEMSRPSETCDIVPLNVPARDLYQAIKKILFGNG